MRLVDAATGVVRLQLLPTLRKGEADDRPVAFGVRSEVAESGKLRDLYWNDSRRNFDRLPNCVD